MSGHGLAQPTQSMIRSAVLPPERLSGVILQHSAACAGTGACQAAPLGPLLSAINPKI
jgi:hypothetical protein